MCGIFAIKSNVVNTEVLHVIYNVIKESQIRGKHSTGITLLADKECVTLKEFLPSSEFLDKHWDYIKGKIDSCQTFSLIAHTRYSTSGLTAQPVSVDSLHIAMNGVITQSDCDKWNNLFNIDCVTDNDSELMLRSLDNNINPYDGVFVDYDPSFAAVVLNTDNNKLHAFRNHKRPLYVASGEGFNIVASTADIINRSSNLSPIKLDSVVAIIEPDYFNIIHEDLDKEWQI